MACRVSTVLPIPTLGVSYSGFVNGETSSVLGGTLSVVDSDAAPTTAVGSYGGVITASGQTSTNYTITYVAGNLTVTPAPLTITANGVSRVYGAADPDAGSQLLGIREWRDVERAGRNLVGRRLGCGADNRGGQLHRGHHGLRSDLDELYDHLRCRQSDGHAGPAHDHGQWCVACLRCFGSRAGSQLLGIREWRDVERAGRNACRSSTRMRRRQPAVGSYTGVITASGQTSTNYTITYVAGNLTVTPAPLTITANGVSRVYGASDPALGVSYSGFVNGETSSVLGGTLSVVDSNAATTTAVGSYAGVITASGQTSTNYTITYVAGNLTVTPAPLTITANGVSRVYGASDPALGVSYSGL